MNNNTIKINSQMLGEDASEQQTEKMVELLQNLGYDVEYTTNTGSINNDIDSINDIISERVWDKFLEQL